MKYSESDDICFYLLKHVATRKLNITTVPICASYHVSTVFIHTDSSPHVYSTSLDRSLKSRCLYPMTHSGSPLGCLIGILNSISPKPDLLLTPESSF